LRAGQKIVNINTAPLNRNESMIAKYMICPLGRYRALWEVLPTIELLLRDIKVFVDRYTTDTDSLNPNNTEYWDPIKDRYLCNHLQLRWEKLDKYYWLTNKLSAYASAIALHL
jgi:hypothetical protein